jgi:hypothetical protein
MAAIVEHPYRGLAWKDALRPPAHLFVFRAAGNAESYDDKCDTRKIEPAINFRDCT